MEKTRTSSSAKTTPLEGLQNVAFYFLLGATLYSLIEVAWRGYTHWTMAILGGVVTVLLKALDHVFPAAPMLFKATVGAAAITILELIAGIIINHKHNLGVWSYDTVPYNILGQICPIYTLYWFLLCIAAFYLFRFIELIRA